MNDTLAMAVAGPTESSDASSLDLAFEDLYRQSRDDVFAYVATLLRDRAAAEDATALAFERAYRKRRTFSARRGSRRAWLFGIARTVVRRRREQTLDT